ncbi:CBS and ACT domain-containing protein [Alkalicoccus halolimnae]|uniref:CBS and ACT domain-containing protein n=1 Tax=Alkalicoccus halolimnae TaxID=1667239 RepID=A0A5C7F187_9BACI|nr:CBS and ACT domain-containing protein [Alkalicoccus halolimnae]TXF81579.1 CBS domain-containing protein [Alkalicoccus halolimnae]
MRVEEVMQKNIIPIDPSDTVQNAMKLMNGNRVRHLPVLDPQTSELIGIVSNRDLRELDNDKTIQSVMIDNVHTAFPGDFVEEAAYMMLENRIHCLPVVSNTEKVIGILTDTDLLQTLVRLTGSDRPSSRVEVEVPDESGQLAAVTATAKQYSLNIQSIFVIPSAQNRMRIVMRIQTMNPQAFVKALKHQGYDIIWPEEPEMK